MALPLLDAMVPAATALAKTPAKPVRRLGYVFMPMGADMSRWTPKTEKSSDRLSDELTPILKSLAPVKDKISVISNLELANAYPGSHATSNSAFLSCAKAKVTESHRTITWARPSIKSPQSASGAARNLPSLEIAMDLLKLVGQCDNGYACVYQNNLFVVLAYHAAASRGASSNRL